MNLSLSFTYWHRYLMVIFFFLFIFISNAQKPSNLNQNSKKSRSGVNTSSLSPKTYTFSCKCLKDSITKSFTIYPFTGFIDSTSNMKIYNFWASWCKPCRHEIPFYFSKKIDSLQQAISIYFIDAEMPSSNISSFYTTNHQKLFCELLCKSSKFSNIKYFFYYTTEKTFSIILPNSSITPLLINSLPINVFLIGSEKLVRDSAFSDEIKLINTIINFKP